MQRIFSPFRTDGDIISHDSHMTVSLPWNITILVYNLYPHTPESMILCDLLYYKSVGLSPIAVELEHDHMKDTGQGRH